MRVKAEGFKNKQTNKKQNNNKTTDNNNKHISLQASWQLDEEAMVQGSLLSLVNIDCVTNIKAL